MAEWLMNFDNFPNGIFPENRTSASSMNYLWCVFIVTLTLLLAISFDVMRRIPYFVFLSLRQTTLILNEILKSLI